MLEKRENKEPSGVKPEFWESTNSERNQESNKSAARPSLKCAKQNGASQQDSILHYEKNILIREEPLTFVGANGARSWISASAAPADSGCDTDSLCR